MERGENFQSPVGGPSIGKPARKGPSPEAVASGEAGGQVQCLEISERQARAL